MIRRQEYSIDLRDFGALEGLQLSASEIDHIPHIIQTITSSNFAVIHLTLSYEDLEHHLEHPEDWVQLDLELCLLADRIQLARGGLPGWHLLLKNYVTSPGPDCDFQACAKCLLPESWRHSRIDISWGFLE